MGESPKEVLEWLIDRPPVVPICRWPKLAVWRRRYGLSAFMSTTFKFFFKYAEIQCAE